MDGKEYNWKEDVRDFLGGYFHQDVDDAYEALDEFIEECSREGKKRTLLNMEKFLGTKEMTELEKEKFIEDETEIYYPGYNITPLEWLEYIKNKLEENLNK